MTYLPGKVPPDVLEEAVFKHLGEKRKDVVLGPSIGEDAAIVKVGKEILVIAADPVTGAEEWLGWLAVNVNANDVATCGVQPRWFTSCMLLPEGTRKELIAKICTQMDEAARQLKVAIIGGHCEITPRLGQPIVTGCAIGVAADGRYVTSGGAKVGNKIVLTKGAGIEGTAIFASDQRQTLLKVLDESLIQRAERFFEQVSVVDDAITAFNTGGVTAMHDPTEGGIAGGLHELADASNVGFQVFEETIWIAEETRRICAHFALDPLQLISSGSLLIVAEEERTEEIVRNLSRQEIPAAIIGEITDPRRGRTLVTRRGTQTPLAKPVTDQLWTALLQKK